MGYVLLSTGAQPAVSDTAASSIAAPVTLTASYVSTSSFTVAGYKEVDVQMAVTNGGAGPITSIYVTVEYTMDVATSPATEWSPYQVEDITAATGASVPATYEIRQGSIPAAPYNFTWTVQARGVSMRFQVKANAGNPTGSVIALSYLRRA